MPFKCKDCNKIYLRPSWAKKHSNKHFHEVMEIPDDPTISYYDLVCRVNEYTMKYSSLERKYAQLEAKLKRGVTITTTTTIQHDSEMEFVPVRTEKPRPTIQIPDELKAVVSEFKVIVRANQRNETFDHRAILGSTEITLKNLIAEQEQELKDLAIALESIEDKSMRLEMMQQLENGEHRLESMKKRIKNLI